MATLQTGTDNLRIWNTNLPTTLMKETKNKEKERKKMLNRRQEAYQLSLCGVGWWGSGAVSILPGTPGLNLNFSILGFELA